MQTARSKTVRNKVLEEVFEIKSIISVWRNIVKDQLRDQDLKDLWDNYDFNFNIEQRAVALRDQILAGNYKAATPIIFKTEKKYGICRHLVIPQPTDALVLQILVEHIVDDVLSRQPSINTFFIRSKKSLLGPHEFDGYGLSWHKQWKIMQKKIYKFNDTKELIIVTDLSNYYDSIDIRELRKVFTSTAEINEVILDIMFKTIEDVSWKPDYLPYSNRGLPTTNIEAIRLLAHSFLFEIDTVIKERVNDNFVRWMDDITIGVNSRKEAIEIISSVSDMLKSRGLALNLAKTNIYTSEEGFKNFQIEANRYLDQSKEINKSELHKRFKQHLKDTNSRYWVKVSKRYITAYWNINSTYLLYILCDLYVNYPDLRAQLIIYLKKVGYSKRTGIVVLKILDTINLFDDISLFQLCELVVTWSIATSKRDLAFIHDFQEKATAFLDEKNGSSDYYALLLFRSKYNSPLELLGFLESTKSIWESDSFLKRQVTAVLGRIYYKKPRRIMTVLFNQIASGLSDTVSIANQVLYFTELGDLPFRLRAYLFSKHTYKTYPHSKFLILCTLLNSSNIRNNKAILKLIKRNIYDPYYLKWISDIYATYRTRQASIKKLGVRVSATT